MEVVRRLSSREFQGRATGTPGGARTREFIAHQFRQVGLTPARHGTFVHPFRLPRAGRPGGREPVEGANVAGLIDGTASRRRVIVVSAHFDHVGLVNGRLFPGADDNASGVAVLLAAARHFAGHPPRHTMLFVAFDAEEHGLAGSRAFVADPPVPLDRVVLNVNFDMVSRSARRELFVAGTFHTPSLRPPLEDVRRRSGVRLTFGHDRPDGPGEDWTEESDHRPFHDAGIPFVYFGVEDHADYHKPTDTADRIDPGFLGDVADTIIEALIALDRTLD